VEIQASIAAQPSARQNTGIEPSRDIALLRFRTSLTYTASR